MTRTTALRGTLKILLALAGALAASGQTGTGAAELQPSATITFVQGSDLTVVRNGSPLDLVDPLGAALQVGDQLQTGARTQVELLLQPRHARVRLAENTVLTIKTLDPSGASSLALLYGRLRSKVEKLGSVTPDFSVQAGVVSAGVRGTDFGCDLVAGRSGSVDSSPVLVYCFEGTVAVSVLPAAAPAGGANAAAAANPPAAPAPVLITAGSMARVEPALAAAPPRITTTAISPDIREFWSDNEFSALPPGSGATVAPAASPPQAAGATATPAQEGAPAPRLAAEDLGRYRKAVAGKNATIAGGLAFSALSAALEGGAVLLRPSNANLADMLALGGLVCAVTGVPILVVAISVDPFKP
ncbi:MAG TPA: FecR family protein [Rectinemataceae bacterium]|nr:FecR family protein [Rectinemataceae bacterium]